MIKAILFDLWNTLAKSNNWKESFNLAGYNGSEEHKILYEKEMNTKPFIDEQEMAEKMHKLFGKGNINEIKKSIVSIKAEFFPEVLPAINKLKEMGYLIGVVSNTHNLEIKHLDLSFADTTIISSEVGMIKPNPEIYELACIELGVKASECIFVGDTPRTDFIGPEKAGMTPILISRYGYNQEYKPIKNLNELIKRLENG